MAKNTRTTDEQIICALLRYGTKKKAAEMLGINRGTIINRFKRDSFRQKYKAALNDTLTESIDCLKLSVGQSVTVLLKVAQDEDTPVATRVTAADALLRHANKFMESYDFEERLAALEREKDE